MDKCRIATASSEYYFIIFYHIFCRFSWLTVWLLRVQLSFCSNRWSLGTANGITYAVEMAAMWTLHPSESIQTIGMQWSQPNRTDRMFVSLKWLRWFCYLEQRLDWLLLASSHFFWLAHSTWLIDWFGFLLFIIANTCVQHSMKSK